MRFYIALWMGKFINFLINIVDKRRGSNLSGEKAILIDPKMIAHFKGTDTEKMLFITGTNGKSTTNNLINHIFSGNGFKVISNLEGANLMAGVATALIKNASIFGRVKADYFIFEVDERFLPSIHELLPAKNIMVTNLQKDQVHRNGDPDFIYRKILPVIKKDVRLFLNGNEPRSRSFSSFNSNVITFGVEKHSESFTKDETFPTMPCPVCGGRIDFEYYNNDGMGAFICTECGLKSGNTDYTVNSADFNEKRFYVSGVEFPMPYNIPYMLYNYAAAVAAAREIGGITVENAAGAFKTFRNVGGRYEVLRFEEKTIKYLRIKQENPETLQTSINIITSDGSSKMVCIGPGHIPDSVPNYTNTFYMFDCDFSRLAKSNVEKFLFFTKYVCYDAANRLVYEGVSPDKIQIIEGEDAADILDAIRNVKTDNVYLITWIHTFNDMQKQAKLKEKEEE